jgi:hypothetical protein
MQRHRFGIAAVALLAVLGWMMAYTCVADTANVSPTASPPHQERVCYDTPCRTGICCEGIPVTVRTKFALPRGLGDKHQSVVPVIIHSADDLSSPALSVRWSLDKMGWIEMGKLEVQGQLVLEGVGGAEATTYQHPVEDHAYEAVLSYDPGAGVLFVRVTDLSADVEALSGAFRAQKYARPLCLRAGIEGSALESGAEPMVIETYGVHKTVVPVGARWEVVEQTNAGYAAISDRRVLSGTALGIRLLTLGAELGGSFWIQVGDNGFWVPSPSATESPHLSVPLGSVQLPRGLSILELHYVDEAGNTWNLGSREIEVVKPLVEISFSRPKQKGGYLESEVALRADGPLPGLTLSVGAHLSQPRWEDGYDEDVNLVVKEVDISRDWLRLPLRIPVQPDRCFVLQINYEAALSPSIEAIVEGAEHYVLVEPCGPLP